jgi:hypothetical protein
MLYTGISYASVATSIALRGSTRSIHTLSPFKLGTDDLITLSNQHQQRISIHAPPPDVPGRPRIGGTVISYKAYKNVDRSPDGHGPRDILLKFPAVRGFLYYHPGPSHASIAGEVRFRVVDSGRSADFSQGVDLEEPRRPLPWRIPLVTIAQNKSQYKDLCALLLGESHPSGDGPELQPACAGTANLNSSLVAQVLAGTLDAPSISTESVIVHSLGRPFCVDLQCAAHTFHVAHHHRLSKAHLYWMTDQRITGGVRTKTQPYTGAYSHDIR